MPRPIVPFAACGRSLAPAGVLVIGWNDSPEKKLIDARASGDRAADALNDEMEDVLSYQADE